MSAQTISNLTGFVEALESFDYIVVHEPVSSDNLIEKLFISLEIENQPEEKQFLIEFLYINDVLEALNVEENTSETETSDDDTLDEEEDFDDDSILSQFTLVLPIIVPAEAELEILRFCGLANRFAPLGAFNYSESDQAIYLRYTLTTESRQFSESLLFEVVSVYEYLCREYMQHFTHICEGRLTTAEFINKFEEEGIAIPTMGNPALLKARSNPA